MCQRLGHLSSRVLKYQKLHPTKTKLTARSVKIAHTLSARTKHTAAPRDGASGMWKHAHGRPSGELRFACHCARVCAAKRCADRGIRVVRNVIMVI